MRFDTKEERDLAVEKLKAVLGKRFDKDDGFVETHKCYHDEGSAKSCELEEIALAKVPRQIDR